MAGEWNSGSLALHLVRPSRLPDLPPLPLPGGPRGRGGAGRRGRGLVPPGVCQQSRRQTYRTQPAISLSRVKDVHHDQYQRQGAKPVAEF